MCPELFVSVSVGVVLGVACKKVLFNNGGFVGTEGTVYIMTD